MLEPLTGFRNPKVIEGKPPYSATRNEATLDESGEGTSLCVLCLPPCFPKTPFNNLKMGALVLLQLKKMPQIGAGWPVLRLPIGSEKLTQNEFSKARI